MSKSSRVLLDRLSEQRYRGALPFVAALWIGVSLAGCTARMGFGPSQVCGEQAVLCDTNASCASVNGQETCVCNPGYVGDGEQCTAGDACTASPCQNGGTCSVTADGYACTCVAPFGGPQCETDTVDGCVSNPCQNGGTCADVVDGYSCTCLFPYTGDNCELDSNDPCLTNPCQNGGTCVAESSGYSCSCLTPFSGTNCEIDTSDPCPSSPCQNGGTCFNEGGGNYTCTCTAPFGGPNCENDTVDECTPSPCQNGGSCTDGINSYTCGCVVPFTGTNCETNSSLGNGLSGCTIDAECTSGNCDTDASTAPETGRCCQGTTGGAGTLTFTGGVQCCDGSSDTLDCGSGNYCRVSVYQCVDGAVGSVCDDNSDCDAANYCNGGTCAADIPDGSGSTCDDDLDCASSNCDTDSTTGPEIGRCCQNTSGGTGTLVFGGGFQCCDGSSDTGDCGAGNYCRVSVYQCVDGGVGSVCDNDADCDPENFCNGGACAADLGNGASTVCNDDLDCASSNCDTDASTAPETGRCCQSTIGGTGTLTFTGGVHCCDGSSDTADCGSGNYCRTSVYQCVDGAIGSVCDDDGDCDAASYCNGGVCTADISNGSSTTCSDDLNCASGNCDTNSTTAPETGRCCQNSSGGTGTLTFAGGFHCCDGAASDAVDCGSGNYCRLSVFQCVDGAVGSVCDDDGDCDATSFCNAGTCTADLGNGASTCNDDLDCTSGNCDTDTNASTGPESGRCCQNSSGGAGTLTFTGGFQCCDGSSDSADCGSGNYCRVSVYQCVDGAVGSVCDDDADCDAANYCNAGTCAADISNGATICGDDLDCSSGNCDTDTSATTGPESGRCCQNSSGGTGTLTFAGGFQCCDGASSDAVDCGSGNYCRTSVFQCVDGAVGSVCDNDSDCDAANFCNGGTCAADLANGSATCNDDLDCSSGNCDTDTTASTGPESGRCCQNSSGGTGTLTFAGGFQCCDGSGTDAADCGSGNYCRLSVFQCVDGAVGSVCDNDADCDAANFCNGGTCAADLTNGSTTCNDDLDCSSSNCDTDTTASTGPESGRCCQNSSGGTGTLTFAGGFQCCDGSTSDAVDCGSGNYCRTSVFQCVDGAVGSVCDDDADCDAANFCNGGTCAADLTNGATTCNDDADCSSSNCDMDTTASTGPESGRCCQNSSGGTGTLAFAGGFQCCDGSSSDTVDCGSGNYCRLSVFQCVDGAVGSVCDNDADCDAANFCNGGTCAADLTNGATTCNDDLDCSSGNCDTDTTASTGPESGRCCQNSSGGTGTLTFAGGFQCCDGSTSDAVDCGSGNYCRTSVFQCVDGAASSVCDNDGDCDSANYCNAGSCAVLAAPTGLSLFNPSTSPYNDSTPTIRVSGVISGHTISIFTDSGCTVPAQKGSAVASGTTVDVTSSALAEGSYTFYAKAATSSGNASACSTFSVGYQYDGTPPPTPTVVMTDQNTGDTTHTNHATNNITIGNDAGVSKWCVKETATAPASNDACFATTEPTSYTLTGRGVRTIYVFTQDAATNVSTAGTTTFDFPLPSVIDLTGPSEVSVSACSDAFTFNLYDSYGLLSPTNGVTAFTLSDASTGVFYSDVGCTSSGSTLNLADAVNNGKFYYKRGGTNGTVTITITGVSTSDSVTLTLKHVYAKTTSIYSASCMIYQGGIQCSGSPSNGQLGNGDPNTHRPTMVQVTGITTGATYIDAGHDYFCAVVDGAVKCWGYNGSGNLGNNTTTSSSTPVTPIASGARRLSVGRRSSCAVVGEKIYCWGGNSDGQLGDGTTTQRNSPVEIISSGATDVAMGWNTTCAVVNGGVKCWGYNGRGQIGDGTTTDRQTPTNALVLTSGVSRVFVGDDNVCAITTAGALYCWGQGTYGMNGDGTTTTRTSPVAISGFASGVTSVTKSSHSMCVVKSGGLFCSGQNLDGLLGQGTMNGTVVSTLTSVPGYTTGVAELHEGLYYTSCLTMTDNTIRCWGADRNGGFADGTKTQIPVSVTSTKFTSGVASYGVSNNFAFDESRACALYTDQSVKCFGVGAGSSQARLGISDLPVDVEANRNDPTQVDTLGAGSGATFLSVGAAIACVIQSGAAKCWGQYNLGQGSATWAGTPVTPTGLTSGVTHISSSDFADFTCAVHSGAVKCWGENDYGQVGKTASTSPELSPYTVIASGATQVEAGEFFACAIVDDPLTGTVSTVSGSASVTGTGTSFTTSLVVGDRVKIGTANYAVATITSNTALTLATSATQTLSGTQISRYQSAKCWGRNDQGQLGNNSTADSITPVTAISSNVTQLAVGAEHACALVSGGVKCWGEGTNGRMGDGSTGDNLVANDVRDELDVLLSGVTYISAGNRSSCAILSTGAVKCWGGNSHGELGDGTFTDRSRAVDPMGMGSGIAKIEAGDTTCAVTTSGSLRCMGENLNAALTLSHDFVTTSFVEPVRVGQPAALTISGPATSTPGACSTAFTITVKDSAGATINATSNTTVTLGEPGTGAFYSDSGCSSSITTRTITSGTSTATFYYKAAAAQKVGFTATASRLATGAIAHSVQ